MPYPAFTSRIARAPYFALCRRGMIQAGGKMLRRKEWGDPKQQQARDQSAYKDEGLHQSTRKLATRKRKAVSFVAGSRQPHRGSYGIRAENSLP